MSHRPHTRQRSKWTCIDDERLTEELMPFPTSAHRRHVHDGTLLAFVSTEDGKLHLSLSFRDHRGNLSRVPTWDEQVDAVRALLPTDLAYHSILPPDDEYVSVHDTTMHWWEWDR